MTEVVAHRGPDDFGWEVFGPTGNRLDKNAPSHEQWIVGLGHRRLSILDLSIAGHQPMCYRDRYWLTFNGEIYNFVELREELKVHGHSFHSNSDSEVILAAFAEWGTDSFARLRGMWGMVILDATKRQAFLSRDRMGIKPLYLWQRNGLTAVASEIKQFLGIPGFQPAMNMVTCPLYLLTGYEDPLGSLFSGVRQVPPGCWQTVDLDSMKPGTPEAYWHPERLRATIDNRQEAGRLFAETLSESVKIHLRSDVPVGCALSGGLDSSTIAALINDINLPNGGSLKTFSAVFPGFRKDERAFIDIMLRNIAAEPFFVTPTAETFLQDLNRLIWIHDEPPGSAPQYSAYCISRLTHQMGVPVTLNGQGGDEVLGGYWQLYFAFLLGCLRNGHFFPFAGQILGSLLPQGNPDLVSQIPLMWRRYKARTQTPISLQLRGVDENHLLANSKARHYLTLSPQAQRLSQIRDMFLPQLLKWDDRNFMAFSVEGRYPLLDHKVIELCLQFKAGILYDRGWTKCPLRSGFKSLLPPEILHRRSKFSFDTPVDEWFCGPLRPEIERWLKSDRPLWQWMEPKIAGELAHDVWSSTRRETERGQMLFRLFVFDRWLEVFNVSLGLT